MHVDDPIEWAELAPENRLGEVFTRNNVLTITFDDHDVVAELSLVMTTISRPLPSGDRS